MAVFWDVAPCSLVEIGRRFRDNYCLNHRGSWCSSRDSNAGLPTFLPSNRDMNPFCKLSVKTVIPAVEQLTVANLHRFAYH
jgi:hypothetical protein